MPTNNPLRRAALVLAAGLLPVLVGCGPAPEAEVTAAAAPPAAAPAAVVLAAAAQEARRTTVPAASRAVVRPAFGDRVISLAAKFAGTPYVWGGTTPRGFDCSGYTRYVYAKLGKELPRTSREQYNVSKRIARNVVQKGELVFTHTRGGTVYHVGIYAGDGLFWHAPNPNKRIRLDKLEGRRWSAGRL